MNMEILIRPAQPSDLPLILKGIRAICRIEKQKPESKRYLTAVTRAAIKKKVIRVLTKHQQPLGFLQFQFSKKSPYGLEYGNYDRQFCWLEWLYVEQKYRQQGYGELLCQDLKSICKKKKVKEIMLDVFQINSKAREFFHQMGFQEFIHILKRKV